MIRLVVLVVCLFRVLFVREHNKTATAELSIFGEEKTLDTAHGLAGDIRSSNSYYGDIHSSVGKFDFIMANPPFNVNIDLNIWREL